MIMLDKWDALANNQLLDQDAVDMCKDLAFSMCACIFDRLGLDVQTDGTTLIASGRGLRYVFQLRDRGVPMKIFEPSRPRPPRKGDRGASSKMRKAHG
jgi:hypothetical protein